LDVPSPVKHKEGVLGHQGISVVPGVKSSSKKELATKHQKEDF